MHISGYRYLLLGLALALGACGGGSNDSNPSTVVEPSPAPTDDPERSYTVSAPSSYDPATPTPLIIALHGYSSWGNQLAEYFRLADAAERHGFLYVAPDGVLNNSSLRFWDATDACCRFDNVMPDDVSFISSIIDDVIANYNVDDKRVFVIGISNGGFMSHRMACDISSRVAAIVSLAGAQWNNASMCPASEPVSVLQVHGDLDDVIFYGGGNNFGAVYPSALGTVERWATLNGCTGSLLDGPMNIDIDTVIPGNETRVQYYADCPAAGEVELWTIIGGAHVPSLDDSWADQIWSFLNAHPKP